MSYHIDITERTEVENGFHVAGTFRVGIAALDRVFEVFRQGEMFYLSIAREKNPVPALTARTVARSVLAHEGSSMEVDVSPGPVKRNVRSAATGEHRDIFSFDLVPFGS